MWPATTTSTSAPQIAITHVVTSAAHAGRPDRVAGVDASFAAKYHDGEVGFTDCLVGDGLLRLQQGDAAGAVRVLEAVVDGLGEAASGYSLSALAMARAGNGDVVGALAAADAATKVASSTFSDRATARHGQGARRGAGRRRRDRRRGPRRGPRVSSRPPTTGMAATC